MKTSVSNQNREIRASTFIREPSTFFVGAFVTLSLALVLLPRLIGADLVLIGAHPTSSLTGFPTIHTLKAFEGRIYLGYGNWNVFPAVVVASYEPASQSFHLEFSAPTDTIGIFREIRGALYMPSIDPILHADSREYSYRAAGVWRDSGPTGMRHIFDAGTLDGNDLWLVGSKSINETSTDGAAVFRSTDDGRTWQDLTLQSTVAEGRYYWGFPLRGRFYVQDTYYEGTNSTRITAAPYRHVNEATQIWDGANEFIVAVTGWQSGIGPPLARPLVTYDTQTWRVLRNNVYDFALSGANLFTLETNTPVNALWMASAVTPSQAIWQRLNFNNVPPNAKTLEVFDGVVYVGDAQGRLWAGRLDGGAINPPQTSVVNELTDNFGRALSGDGDVLAVGAPDHSGAAPLCGQVTIWEQGEAGSWARTATIDPPAASFSGWFGKDLAVKDNVIAVLEAGRDLSRTNRGTSAQVHLYELSGQNWEWRRSLNHAYAQSVAFDSGWLAVGATNSLFLYQVARGPNTFEVTLRTNFVVQPEYFQDFQALARVTLEGDICAFAVIGDIGVNASPGQVHIYQRDGAEIWRLRQALQSNAPVPTGLSLPPDRFGFSLALQSGWLGVGAPRDDTAALQAGAVHLYVRTNGPGGASFVLRQSISSPLNQPEALFGSSVALKDSTLLVGCPGAEANGQRHHGAAYVFRRGQAGWSQLAEVLRPLQSQGEFGAAVVLGSNWLAASSRFSGPSQNLPDRVTLWPLGPVAGQLSEPRRLSNTDFQLTVQGEIGRSYFIEASADLASPNWTELFSFTLIMPKTNLVDITATTATRFYRLRSSEFPLE
jgi:FG-GAP repeat protein